MKMLETEPYLEAIERWPKEGRHIVSQFDDESIVVYQAYNQSIAEFADQNDKLGGPGFSFDRMSWIRPNFLSMMYQSNWGTMPNQDRILAIRIMRSAFDEMLLEAVETEYHDEIYHSESEWKTMRENSMVRIQWDTHRDPQGRPVSDRKTVQIGLQQSFLRQFALDWILEIEDITPSVELQHQNVLSEKMDALMVPRERIYPLENQALRHKIRLSKPPRRD